MNLNRRLEALERGLIMEPAILTMPDGSTVRIPGHGDYLLRLYESAVSSTCDNPRHTAHLELIRRARGSEEPDGGHMVELIRCLLHGPVQEGA